MKSFTEKITENENITREPNGFCLLKPGCADEHADDFCRLLEHYGWDILSKKRCRLSSQDAADLYVSLANEPYYGDLCDYMSSGDCFCCSCRTDAADPIAEMASFKKLVREMWGEDEMRNAMHSSDSLGNVVREAAICMKEEECAQTDGKDDAVDEGLFKAVLGGAAGMTVAPAIMKALCSVLGVDPKGQFGSILTSRLVLTALCAKMGWDR